MERKILIDILDDFAFGSHNIEQTADRIISIYEQNQQKINDKDFEYCHKLEHKYQSYKCANQCSFCKPNPKSCS